MEFKTIPGYHQRYRISEEGVVWDDVKHIALTPWISPHDYRSYSLYRPDGKKTVGNRHRLMMLAWRPIENMEDLVVNHINGIAGDDWLDNFEWCTYRENSEHAGRLGLTTKCKAVELKDTSNGNIYYFDSATAAAREMGVTKDRILYRCHHDKGRVYDDGLMYRFAIDVEWGESYRKAEGRIRSVLVLELLTMTATLYRSLSEFADKANVCLATAHNWVTRENMPVLPGFIQMKYLEDPTPWRAVDDPYLDYELSSGTPIYVIHNKITNVTSVGCSLKDVSAVIGVKHTTIHMRFKQSKKRDFGDFIVIPYQEFIRSSGYENVQLNVL